MTREYEIHGSHCLSLSADCALGRGGVYKATPGVAMSEKKCGDLRLLGVSYSSIIPGMLRYTISHTVVSVDHINRWGQLLQASFKTWLPIRSGQGSAVYQEKEKEDKKRPGIGESPGIGENQNVDTTRPE